MPDGSTTIAPTEPATEPATPPVPPIGPTDEVDLAGGGGLRGAFGPLTGVRIVVLIVAFAFLAGALGYTVGHRKGGSDPLSATDVGFMQDMGYHHDQANQMAILLIGKDDVDPDLKNYAMEILMGQRLEMGVFTATLDRYGHSSSPGRTAMGWMGPAIPLNEMDGLATSAQMKQLTNAKGRTAEALWIALMSEHHLGGMHMADWEALHGHDATTKNLAQAEVSTQRSDIIDLARYRTMHQLPIPKGFTDPTKDQRLNPLSLKNVKPD